MRRTPIAAEYEEAYRARAWAHGEKPDPELVEALADVPRERALDVGGGQGRHALALAALGFEVTLLDAAAEGLRQAAATAEGRGLVLHVLQGDASRHAPEGPFRVIVASLFFHLPARRTALQVARRLGGALAPGGLLYLSLPHHSRETCGFARELVERARCEEVWVRKALVTKKDRPRLQVGRRNETRALGRRPEGR